MILKENWDDELFNTDGPYTNNSQFVSCEKYIFAVCT